MESIRRDCHFGGGPAMVPPPSDLWLEGCFTDLTLMMDSNNADTTENTVDQTTWNFVPEDLLSDMNKTDLASESIDVIFDQSTCLQAKPDCSPSPIICSRFTAFSPYGELDNMNSVCVASPDELLLPGEEPATADVAVQDVLCPEMSRQYSINTILEVIENDGVKDCDLSSVLCSTPSSACSSEHDSEQFHAAEVTLPRNRNASWCDGFSSETIDCPLRVRSASEDVTHNSNSSYLYDVDAFLNQQSSTGAQLLAGKNCNNNCASVASPSDDGFLRDVNAHYASDPPVEKDCQREVLEILNDIWCVDENQQRPIQVEVAVETSVPIPASAHATLPASPSVAPVPSKEGSVASANIPVIDLTDTTQSASTSKKRKKPALDRSESYTRKRARNNEACRESRKRKRQVQETAELKITDLVEDNKRLRTEITKLEMEVRLTKELVLSQMKK